jgi:hypothetical protein
MIIVECEKGKTSRIGPIVGLSKIRKAENEKYIECENPEKGK